EDASGPVGFTMQAAGAGFSVAAVSPLRGTTKGNSAIIDLRGSQFTPLTQVTLTGPGGAARSAQSVQFVNPNRIVATIPLADLPTGLYDVAAVDGSRTVTAIDKFEVTDTLPGKTFVNAHVYPTARANV